MRAGLLNRRVLLQRQTMTTDAEGFSPETWTTVRPIWAQIQPNGGSEVFLAGTTQENITHTITVRFAADLDPLMRFLYGVRVFFIHNILDIDEDHKEATCLCEEFVTGPVFIAKTAPLTLKVPALAGAGHTP